MTPATFELMKTAARTLLAHQAAGRSCDPDSVRWAQQLLAQNPKPQRLSPSSADQDHLHATRSI